MSRAVLYLVSCLAFVAGLFLYSRAAFAQTNCPNQAVLARSPTNPNAPQSLCTHKDLVICEVQSANACQGIKDGTTFALYYDSGSTQMNNYMITEMYLPCYWSAPCWLYHNPLPYCDVSQFDEVLHATPQPWSVGCNP